MKEVSLELSKQKDEKIVMWVFDSFSTLVSNALVEKKKIEYNNVFASIFNLRTSIIPVAVCSSATSAGALNECNESLLS